MAKAKKSTREVTKKAKPAAKKRVSNAITGEGPTKDITTLMQSGVSGKDMVAKNSAVLTESPFVPGNLKKTGGSMKPKASVTKEPPVILVVNDDGVTAPGIRNLVEAVKNLGKIVVVAPDKPQSGMGHAITIGQPLRLQKVEGFGDVDAWSCSGTPVDCVKLAVDKVLHRKPDICLSGINHGANHSINVIYSGTMSAAMEAAIESVPSVGFSLLDHSVNADFTGARKYANLIVKDLLNRKLEKHLLLNVNIPAVDVNLIKGAKLCRQAYAKYEENFLERDDPNGRKYFWLTGEFVNFDKGKDTDVWALKNNYVSVVPVQFDLTNYVLRTKLEKTWKL